MSDGSDNIVESHLIQSLDSPPGSILVVGPTDGEFSEVQKILRDIGLLHPHTQQNRIDNQLMSEQQSKSYQVASSIELDFNRAANALDQDPDVHLLLFYKNLEFLLASALIKDNELEPVLKDWNRHAQSVLQLFRKHRRRTTMIDLESMYSRLDQTVSMLSQRLLLDLRTSATAPPQVLRRDDHLIKLFSCCIMQDYPVAKLVAAELEAGNAMCVFSEKSHIAGTLAEFNSRAKKTHHEAQEAKEENKLLLLQLHQVQEELEAYFLKNQGLEKGLSQAQLNLKTSQATLEKLRHSLDEMHESKSWKITTPLRKLYGLSQRNNT